MKKIVKSFALVALYGALFAVLVETNVSAMQPRLECKTCCDGQAPEKPTPDAKSDNAGDSKAPATPRGK